MAALIGRLYEWIADHARWLLVGVAAMTVALTVPLFWLETNVDFVSYVDHGDPAYLLMKDAERRYGSQTLMMIAIASPDGVFQAGTLEKIEKLESRLSQLEGVKEVDGPLSRDVIVGSEASLDVGPAAPGGRAPTTPEEISAYRDRVMAVDTMRGLLIAEDESAAAILVHLERGAFHYDVAKAVRAVVDEVGTPPERFSIAGEPYMMLSLTESIQGDLVVLIPFVLGAMCLALFLSFRSFRGVWIPLLVVGLAVIWTFGPMALLGIRVSIITFVLPVLLLAIGVAYGIHVMHRYDEELAVEKPKREALIDAMKAITGAVAMAGLTTMGGFLSLLTSPMPLFAEFGVIAAVGVALAFLLALAVVPAVLAVLPAARPRRAKAAALPSGHGNVLGAVARSAARRPAVFLAATVALVVALAFAVPRLRTDSSMTAFLGETHPAVLGMMEFDAHFGGAEQLRIEIDTGRRDGLKEPAVLRRVLDLEAHLRLLGVRKTTSITDLVRELNLRFHANDPAFFALPDDRKQIAQLLVLFSFRGGDLGSVALPDYSSGQVIGFYPRADGATKTRLVREIRSYLAEHFADDVKAEMVGPTQFFDAMSRQLLRSQVTNIYSSGAVVWFIVAAIMGSLLAGLVSVIPLAFTVLAVFAVMALSGTTLNLASATIASITMGTGIDYAVHFLTRYRREVRAGGGAVAAAERTGKTAGRAIVFNAAAVAAGFLVLCTSRFMAFRSFGGLLALAMAASAAAALTMMPALLAAARPRFLTASPWGWWLARRAARRNRV